MKIHPPILEIPTDNPYANDLFGRKDFAESLLSLIGNTDESIVLSIDAPWGDGKSSFARMWLADLKKRGIQCIYYDAYEHDYCDDPFISFSAEIISLAETNFSDNKEVKKRKEEFKSKAIKIGGKVLTVGARIGVKALTLGVINNSDIDDLKNIKEDIAKDVSEGSSKIVGQIFDNYISTKNQIDEFKEKLSNLGKAVKKIQNIPLLIIIDELDRCRPDFALALLERIKHFFTTDGVSFILLANMKQLENYVQTIYGNNIEAHNYLNKFVTLSTRLPKSKMDQYDNDYIKYSRKLIKYHEIDNQPELGSFIAKLFKHYNFSLREMEQCITILTVYFTQLMTNRFNINEVVAFLAVCYVRFPSIFNALESDTLSFKELDEDTKITTLNDSSSIIDSFLKLLEALLVNDERFKELDEETKSYVSWFSRYRLGRKDIFPLLCSELLKFKTQINDK